METEKCIVCSVDTGVPVNLDINVRQYYVEGAGQLCETCYLATYSDL